MSLFEIKPTDTPLKAALEQYYEQLLLLVGERGGQPVLLNNTITTFDIQEKAPFYSEEVFRLFADRKFRQSPDDLGTAMQADRFSFDYERVIDIAATSLDQTLTASQRQDIEANQRQIKKTSAELVKFELQITTEWNKIVFSEKLEPGTTTYILRQINFLESMLYADQKKIFTDEISDCNNSIDAIRFSSYSAAQKKLLAVKNELAETYKIARPWTTSFEETLKDVSLVTFSDPRYRSKTLCDVSPSIYPSINLVGFKNGNDSPGTIEIEEKTTHNQRHHQTWGAGGGGSFSVFGINIGGSAGGSGESDFQRDFSSLKSMKVSFSNVSEVYANRGLWFDPSLFENKELAPVFSRIPGARELEFVAVSLVIARGLLIELEFNENLTATQWSKKNFEGRGGFSVFGYKFGGSANRSEYSYDLQVSNDKRRVKLSDDPRHCRLLAVRLEKIYHPEKVDFPEKHIYYGAVASRALNDGLLKGKLSLAAFQNFKINGFTDDQLNKMLSEHQKK